MVTQSPYEKFKQLLEYFVAHMEYVTNKDHNHPGYELYMRPLGPEAVRHRIPSRREASGRDRILCPGQDEGRR